MVAGAIYKKVYIIKITWNFLDTMKSIYGMSIYYLPKAAMETNRVMNARILKDFILGKSQMNNISKTIDDDAT